MTSQAEKNKAAAGAPTADLKAAQKTFRRSLFLLGLGLVYAVIPTDLIPDVPFVGWIDDLFVLTTTAVNSAYQYRKLKKQSAETGDGR